MLYSLVLCGELMVSHFKALHLWTFFIFSERSHLPFLHHRFWTLSSIYIWFLIFFWHIGAVLSLSEFNKSKRRKAVCYISVHSECPCTCVYVCLCVFEIVPAHLCSQGCSALPPVFLLFSPNFVHKTSHTNFPSLPFFRV